MNSIKGPPQLCKHTYVALPAWLLPWLLDRLFVPLCLNSPKWHCKPRANFTILTSSVVKSKQ